MSDKERIYQALKEKNYFESEKKDSLEVLEKATHLEDVIIQVERNCNVDNLLFQYDPVTRKLCRVTPRQEDVDLLNREAHYDVHPECKKRKCLSKAISITDFIKLLDFVFEPLAVYRVGEI
ncbi:MAG: hypothetical protein HFJ58_04560 [Clostridia bacterium]|nr:hypothetical protein [Clostridia bacterium]